MVGGFHHLGALLASGVVYMWGYNFNGQLGIGLATFGTGVFVSPTQTIFPASTVIMVLAAGYNHSGAISTDTTLWMWGCNQNGELGVGSDTDQPLPTIVGTGYTSLSLGYSHSCALKGTSLYCFGGNYYCSTSDVNYLSDETPFLVAALTNVVEVACGNAITAALRSDGTVWTFGDSQYDDLGQGSTAVQWHCVPGQVPLSLPAIKIASGAHMSCAIVQGGMVYCWGRDIFGDLGVGESQSTHSLTPLLVSGATNVQDITAGFYQIYVLVGGNSLWAWGADGRCELLNVTGRSETLGNIGQDIPKALPGLPGTVVLMSKGSVSSMECVAVI